MVNKRMDYDDDNPPPPDGVTLRDPNDSTSVRKALEENILKATDKYVNGYEYGGVKLVVANPRFEDKERYTLAEVREAKMSDALLHRRLRGDLKLIDTQTNKVLDERKNMTLAKVPYLTDHGTFVQRGSEYAAISQSRLLPGVYTRRRENGETESHFNVRPGTGRTMRVRLNPTNGQFRVQIGTSDLHAYSLFKDLGVSDEELERRWGKELLESNRAGYSKDVVRRAYEKAVPKWKRDPESTPESRVEAIRDSIASAQVASSTLRSNLPNLYDQRKAASWRAGGIIHDQLTKEASTFSPDLSAEDTLAEFNDYDFSSLIKLASGFTPNVLPEEMKATFDFVKDASLASAGSGRETPEHWKPTDQLRGFVDWYADHEGGQTSSEDDAQISRWKSAKAKLGARFVATPTPERATDLQTWAIDPVALLPEEDRPVVKQALAEYKEREYAKWFVRCSDYTEEDRKKALDKAASRGFDKPDDNDKNLMLAAAQGYLKVEDFR